MKYCFFVFIDTFYISIFAETRIHSDAKIYKNAEKNKLIVKILAYIKKKQYFCTNFLNDIHNKDYSDV